MLTALLAQMPERVPARVDYQQAAGFPIEAVLGICLPILALTVVGITLIISINNRKMQRDDMEATLKMEMIERGMSADEIERVLAARIGSTGHACKHRNSRRERREFQPQERG
jgi:hypothetical protein